MKTTTSKQLAKTLKSGREAVKLQNEGLVKGLPDENNHVLAKTLKPGPEAGKLQMKDLEKDFLMKITTPWPKL